MRAFFRHLFCRSSRGVACTFFIYLLRSRRESAYATLIPLIYESKYRWHLRLLISCRGTVRMFESLSKGFRSHLWINEGHAWQRAPEVDRQNIKLSKQKSLTLIIR